jgi:hypothetical protein
MENIDLNTQKLFFNVWLTCHIKII